MDDMKINLRTIIFVLVCLAAALYIWLFLIPQIKAIQSLRVDINAAREAVQINEIYHKRVLALDNEERRLAQDIRDVRQVYPPVLKHSDIVQIVSSLANEAGLNVQSITLMDYARLAAKPLPGQASVPAKNTAAAVISDPQMIDLIQNLGLGGSGGYETNSRAFGRQQIADGEPYFLPVRLEATGTDKEIKDFFASMGKLANKADLKDYSLQPNDNNDLSVKAVFHFYGIADSNARNIRLLDEYIFSGQAGRTGLFSNLTFSKPMTGNARDNRTNPGTEAANEYDFTMRVVPYGNNMAPSTVSLSARGIVDVGKSSVIFGDNPGQEKVDLVVEEKNGHFFCKYKTEHEAFPDKSYSQAIEFKPQGKALKMIIDSTPRKFEADRAGIIMTIDNQTAKRFVVDILNDDNTSPRIKIDRKGGVIELARIAG